MLFHRNNIILNQKFATKEDLFIFLDKIAFSKNISAKENIVYEGFIKREGESTTGFEDGLALPHARIEGILQPSIFIVRNNNKFNNWVALDGGGVQCVIALMIPRDARVMHINVLSTIATQMMKEEFKKIIKHGSLEAIEKIFTQLIKTIIAKNTTNSKKMVTPQDHDNLLIGISACPAGVAHTFMVKQKMENLAHEQNMRIKWETQGANGQQNKLSKQDIKLAKTIIIASDIDLDLSRFKGQKIYVTSPQDAIKNAAGVYARAKSNAKIFTGELSTFASNNFFKKTGNLFLKSFKSNFGVPWTYLSITAVLLSIISLLGFSIYGQIWSTEAMSKNMNLFKMQTIAAFALSMALPLMAMFMVKKIIAKTEAQYITFLSCLLLNIPITMASFNTFNMNQINPLFSDVIFYDWGKKFNASLHASSGILGCIVIIMVVVGIYKLIDISQNKLDDANNKLAKFVQRGFHPWINPIIPAAICLLVIVYMFGSPLSYASSKIVYALINYPRDYWWLRFLIGFIFGALIAWDLGNTINKLTIISLIGLAQYDLRFASLIAISIPIASIGLGTTYFFQKNKFKKEDKEDVALSFQSGLKGTTEGPLNLKIKYKWKIHIPNIFATGLAAGLALVLGIYILKSGHLGILYLGANAHLAQVNDISFLNVLLPRGQGIITFVCSITYGIVSYYLIMVIGSLTYLGIANITFRMGQNKVFI